MTYPTTLWRYKELVLINIYSLSGTLVVNKIAHSFSAYPVRFTGQSEITSTK